MKWLTPQWANRASDPGSLLPHARSVVCVALSYSGRSAMPTPVGSGRLARYAAGEDYHALMRRLLAKLCREMTVRAGRVRPFVDTAPTMDKALAARAGIGWQGKNTNILSHGLGSLTFLGGIVTDLDLAPDEPARDGCGACRACVVGCPTGALRGDYTIDARLCISYLTIEHRGPIPRELRPLVGDWVFGCDICQDVCPPVTARQDAAHPDLRARRIAHVRMLMRDGAVAEIDGCP